MDSNVVIPSEEIIGLPLEKTSSDNSYKFVFSTMNSEGVSSKSNQITSDSSSTNLNVNVTSDTVTLLNATMEIAGKIVTSPVAKGVVTSLGTAAILKNLSPVLKTLPPNQITGVALGIGLASMAGNIISHINGSLITESMELKRTESTDSTKNDFINSPLENDFYSIPSILEFNSNEEALAIVMLMSSAGTFYMVLTMFLSFSIRLFNLESR
jgi:hypothetical protein